MNNVNSINDLEWAEKLNAYNRYVTKTQVLLAGDTQRSYVDCKVYNKEKKIQVVGIHLNEHYKVKKTLRYINESGNYVEQTMDVDEYFLEIPKFVDRLEVQLMQDQPRDIWYVKIRAEKCPFESHMMDTDHGDTVVQDFFGNCVNLEGLDLSEFDFTGVESFEQAFYACYHLKYIIFKPQILESAISLNNAFVDCSDLISVNLHDLKMPNVSYMNGTFQRCDQLMGMEIDFLCGGKHLKEMYKIFQESGIYQVDLSCINVERGYSLVDLECAFLGCANLSEARFSESRGCYIPAGSVNDIFDSCIRLYDLDISGLDLQEVQSLSGMFNMCETLEEVEIHDQNFKNLEIIKYNFNDANLIEKIKFINCNFPVLWIIKWNFDPESDIAEIDLTGQNFPKFVSQSMYAYKDLNKILDSGGYITLGQREYFDEPKLILNKTRIKATIESRQRNNLMLVCLDDKTVLVDADTYKN